MTIKVKQRKSIIVDCNSIHRLQTLLDDGYEVTHTCPMPSSRDDGFYQPTCLVIVEKEVDKQF